MVMHNEVFDPVRSMSLAVVERGMLVPVAPMSDFGWSRKRARLDRVIDE
jgi:hypothetical protein